MKMPTSKFFLIFLFTFSPLVLADGGGCNGHSCNESGGDVVTVGVDVASNPSVSMDSRAYALSGGDMDINDCLATESYLFGLYQRTKPNYLCMADKAQARGELERAAEFRCIYWGVRRSQGGKEECIKRLTYDNPIIEAVEVSRSPMLEDDDEDEREYHESLEEQIARLEEHLEQQIEQAPVPQTIYRDEGAERRAAAKAALKWAAEDGEEN